jgi:uncharacterized phage infection (PIP) family protein YhgE
MLRQLCEQTRELSEEIPELPGHSKELPEMPGELREQTRELTERMPELSEHSRELSYQMAELMEHSAEFNGETIKYVFGPHLTSQGLFKHIKKHHTIYTTLTQHTFQQKRCVRGVFESNSQKSHLTDYQTIAHSLTTISPTAKNFFETIFPRPHCV